MIKVSIIIPAYNVEAYIESCIESARSQTMKDIEIICVNDGSTDMTLSIIESLAQQDKRIRIINKINTGYGASMNVGLDAAKGEYVAFLESDDLILPDMCQRMYGLCKQHELEILKADFYEFVDKGNAIYKQYYKVSDFDNYGKVMAANDDPRIFFASMYTWTCMYKLDFLNAHQIRHNETPGASFQDNGFWFQTFMYAKRLLLLDEAFYLYRQDNPNSSIHSKEKVFAFSDEYSFIRNKIMQSDSSERATLINICAFFNFHHNLNSLLRIDSVYFMDLLNQMKRDFEEYLQIDEFDINRMDIQQTRKLLQCMMQPQKVIARVLDRKKWNETLTDKLRSYSTYILYGAGEYANEMLRVLNNVYTIWNEQICCGISRLPEDNLYLNGIKVECIDDLMDKEDSLIIICAKKDSENYKQMWRHIKDRSNVHVMAAEDFFQHPLHGQEDSVGRICGAVKI